MKINESRGQYFSKDDGGSGTNNGDGCNNGRGGNDGIMETLDISWLSVRYH